MILLIFLDRGYPAAARSVLGLTPENQYVAQVWYQGPLFFATAAITAPVLVILACIAGRPTGYCIAFARVSLATVVPFAVTIMVVEAAVALLLAAGLLVPADLLAWLTGPGSWFALL